MLDTVPPVRRSVDELVRIEVVDRAMAIGAQALLALVPVLVILAAFLPHAVAGVGLDRFEAVTGVGEQGAEVMDDTLATQLSSVTDTEVRTATGITGLLITLFSANSFGRSLQRLYERTWEQRRIGGIAGRGRALVWVFGWIVAMQCVALVSLLDEEVGGATLDALLWALRTLVTAAIWWWSMRFLLAGRVSWSRLAAPALLTGAVLVAYVTGSRLVMPAYVSNGAAQFGTLGVVLAVATWLVGFAGVLVVCAVLGRVLSEDPLARSLWDRLRREARRLRPRAQVEGGHDGHEAVAEQPRAGDPDQQLE